MTCTHSSTNIPTSQDFYQVVWPERSQFSQVIGNDVSVYSYTQSHLNKTPNPHRAIRFQQRNTVIFHTMDNWVIFTNK